MNDKRICIICEGEEEVEYMDKIINLNLFSKNYRFKLINAKSITSIFSRYQEKFQSGTYHIVLIFCDTDKHTQYSDLKKDINLHHDNNVADKIIIFGNPCTMQIILSHFMKIKLSSQSKKENAIYIKEATGICNYDAHENQRKALFNKINRANYAIMKENIYELSTDDKIKSSTNILRFIGFFENKDTSWLDEINKEIYLKD